MTDIPQHLLRNHRDKTDFAPKLNEEERFGVLALSLMGVRSDVLALAFNLHKRTVGHILNPTSKHYKSTRAEHKRMGTTEFIEKYATEAIKKRVIEAGSRPELRDGKPDKSQRRKAGVNVVKPEQCAYSHRLVIEYFADKDPPGWYYRDMDSKSAPDEWFHNGPTSLSASHNCLALAEANLTDD